MSAAQRVLLWVLCVPAGVGLSYMIAAMRMPDAPHWLRIGIGIPMGVALALLIRSLGNAQREAYAVAYLGDAERARAILSGRSGHARELRDLDLFGSAALELTAGFVQQAKARLHIRALPIAPVPTIRKLLAAHLRLVDTEGQPPCAPETVHELLALAPLRMRETERYRLSLIARAALACRDREAAAHAEAALLAHRDNEGRAFAQWLRATFDREIDDNDVEADALRAAELALAHGNPELTARLGDRAAAIRRARAATTPYRK